MLETASSSSTSPEYDFSIPAADDLETEKVSKFKKERILMKFLMLLVSVNIVSHTEANTRDTSLYTCKRKLTNDLLTLL